MNNLMKNKFIILTIAAAGVLSSTAFAQQPAMQYFRPNDQNGLNMFEESKQDSTPFTGLKVRIGGDFALQYQALSQSNESVNDTLVELSNNFNLPTANLNIDVQLADGVRMHLRTYLSSRHHSEAWVKGGYIQFDKLDFIKPGFLSGVMKITRIRFGMDEINYGDAHFRRSDNARAIFNPFVGNYIMDSFTTEPYAEVTVMKNGFLGLIGATNGRLNQTPLPGDDGFVIFGKLGYDRQISEDLRFRLTGSFYTSTDKGTRDYLYNGDRAGARYYNVLETIDEVGAQDFLPRFNPNYQYQTAFQFNPFVKYKGIEFFGIYEQVNNGADAGGGYTQIAGELILRFGSSEQLFIGGRYNVVTGEQTDASESREINRLNVGGGWFLTKNVMAKLDYVNTQYDGDGFNNSKFQGAEFNGVVLEACISF
jgi:hypothetical protein